MFFSSLSKSSIGGGLRLDVGVGSNNKKNIFIREKEKVTRGKARGRSPFLFKKKRGKEGAGRGGVTYAIKALCKKLN